MKLFYSDFIELKIARGSRFPVDKYRRLREHLQENSYQEFDFVRAREASVTTLSLAHDIDYINAVIKGTLPAEQQRKIGFPWSEKFRVTCPNFRRRDNCCL